MGLNVVLVIWVVFGGGIGGFCLETGNSCVLRVDLGVWRCVLVWGGSDGVRVVVVVVIVFGVDVDSGAMFGGQVSGGWYVVCVGGGCILVVVVGVGCSMVFVVGMVGGFL
jgi:hypothetical protein